MKKLLRRTRLCLKLIILPRWYIFVLFGICFGITLYLCKLVYADIDVSIQERIKNGQSMISIDRSVDYRLQPRERP